MKPDIFLSQLRNLDVSRGVLDDLIAGHEELVETYLRTGRRLGANATDTSGSKALGVGITEHVVRGRPTGRPAVLLLVDKLTDRGRGFPVQTGRGAPILVEQVGEIRPLAGFKGRYRPVPGGVSIAETMSPRAGSLGCVVRSKDVRYLLSCSHVLADANPTPGHAATITQQAMSDGGEAPDDVVGWLAYVVPIVPNGVSAADAALAAIKTNVDADPRIIRANDAVEKMVAPVTAPVLGQSVQKSGRTTGHTKGRIQAVGVTFQANHPAGATSFENGFTVKHATGLFATDGDSGAVITTDPGNQPVGLLVSGDAAQKLTYANPMSDVLKALAERTGAEVSIVY